MVKLSPNLLQLAKDFASKSLIESMHVAILFRNSGRKKSDIVSMQNNVYSNAASFRTIHAEVNALTSFRVGGRRREKVRPWSLHL